MDITENGKYYFPELDEFHVGFEDEFYYEKKWHKTVFTNEVTWFNTSKEFWEKKLVRVKYLDHDDIISLGWVKSSSYFPNNPEMCCYELGFNKITFNSDTHIVSVDCYDEQSLDLHIKNKSELQRLMKQLGV